MSADNWTVCPRCEAAQAAMAKRYDDEVVYASQADFERMKRKALEFRATPLLDTLREDYDIGIRNGVFSVSYHAECDCGFKHVFRMNDSKVT